MIATHIMIMVITIVFYLHLMYKPSSSPLSGGDSVAVGARMALSFPSSTQPGLRDDSNVSSNMSLTMVSFCYTTYCVTCVMP